MKEPKERTPPCGVPYCPLINEYRFFAEGHATLIESGLEYREIFPFVGKAVQVWTQGQIARGLPVDPRICREVLNRVVAGLAKVEHKYPYLQATLKRELDKRGAEVANERRAATGDLVGGAGF